MADAALPMPQQQLSSVPTASDSANPDWSCRAIPESTDRSTDQVIFDSKGQPPIVVLLFLHINILLKHKVNYFSFLPNYNSNK